MKMQDVKKFLASTIGMWRKAEKLLATFIGGIALIFSVIGFLGVLLNAWYGWIQYDTLEHMISVNISLLAWFGVAGLCRYIAKD